VQQTCTTDSDRGDSQFENFEVGRYHRGTHGPTAWVHQPGAWGGRAGPGPRPGRAAASKIRLSFTSSFHYGVSKDRDCGSPTVKWPRPGSGGPCAAQESPGSGCSGPTASLVSGYRAARPGGSQPVTVTELSEALRARPRCFQPGLLPAPASGPGQEVRRAASEPG
jgi:hypothetical protein